MKIEKINENKIKCTLNPGDLEARKITVKEIATGSEKAHELLNEMMQKAQAEFGFKAEGVPLMIEAACLPDGQVVLMISKSNDAVPPKGRGRFDFSITKAAEPLQADVALENPNAEEVKTAIDNFFDFAKKQVLGKIQNGEGLEEEIEKALPPAMSFLFRDVDSTKGALKTIKKKFQGNIEVYKNPATGSFFVILYREGAPNQNFNKSCNLMSEYGAQVKNECVSTSYYKEHYDEIYAGCAKEVKIKDVN